MFGILLAVGAATGYSVTGIFARLGSRAVGPGTGVAIAIFSSLVIVMIPALIWYIPDLLEMPLAGFLWIALMAIIATPAGNLLNFTAIREIGASRSAPLFASSPIFAAILAIIFLGERPNAAIGVGTIGMVAGVIFIVSEGRGRDIAIRSVRTILLGYGCGLGAGLCYGSLNVLAKNAIVNYAPPLAVASMATLFGALMMAPLAAVSVPRALQRSRRSVMGLRCLPSPASLKASALSPFTSLWSALTWWWCRPSSPSTP